MIIELGLSPDQTRRINHLPAGQSFGEGQAVQAPSPASIYDVRPAGRMFWFMRKKFVGSYLFFRATRRSYFSP